MKKKLLAIGLCSAMMLGMTACGSNISYDKYDLSEYITVGEYKGLKVAPYSISVTEDEVDARIQTNLEDAASVQEIEAGTAIEDGDTVNIDYTGKIDGKKFDGGSAEGYDLVIGSGSFIDGFETGIIGKTVGDKFDLDLTFPSDYQEESLQGKAVVFTVKVNSASREVVPEFTVDFVQNTSDYNTLEEYEQYVEKTIYDEKEQEAIENQKTTLWSDLLEDTEVKKYPEKELNYYIDFNSEQMDSMAELYGMSREDLLASYDFGDEEEFAAVNEDSSKLRVKQEMLIEYLAQKEGIEYTEKEAEAMKKEYEEAGYDDETVESQTGRTMEEYVHIELLYQKVLEFLLENADITGAPAAE